MKRRSTPTQNWARERNFTSYKLNGIFWGLRNLMNLPSTVGAERMFYKNALSEIDNLRRTHKFFQEMSKEAYLSRVEEAKRVK